MLDGVDEDFVLVGVADDVHRVAAVGDDSHLLFEHAPEHNDADVGDAEPLGRPVGDGALHYPGGLVLAEHPVGLDRAVLVEGGDALVGDDVGGLLSGLGLPEVDDEVEGVGVVHGDAVLEVGGDVEDVGEEDGVPHSPVVVLLGLVADEAALDDAVVGDFEADLAVVGAAGSDAGVPCVALFGGLLAVHHPAAPVAVEPLEVEGVEGVFVALEPVAGEHYGLGSADAGPDEDVDAGEERRGSWAHIGEDDAAELLRLVRLDADLVLELGAFGLGGLVDALALLVEDPAVVGAAYAVGLGDAVGEAGLAVGAGGLDEAERA